MSLSKCEKDKKVIKIPQVFVMFVVSIKDECRRSGEEECDYEWAWRNKLVSRKNVIETS